MKARTLLPLLGVALSLGLAQAARADAICQGSQVQQAVKLTVDVTGVKAAEGKMVITLYPDDSRRFLAPHGKLARLRIPAIAPVTTSCFWVQPGAYAIAIYHDANGNNDFDRTLTGMPAEGYGFSNDAPTKFGLPSFDSVLFKLPAGAPKTVHIQVRYPK